MSDRPDVKSWWYTTRETCVTGRTYVALLTYSSDSDNSEVTASMVRELTMPTDDSLMRQSLTSSSVVKQCS